MESVYENALVWELQKCGLQVEQQKELKVLYDGQEVGRHRIDLLVNNQIIVELKAVAALEDVFFAIVRSYLNAAGLKHGLILNFRKTKLEMRRVIGS
jgi:GxxExxY protein